MQIEIKIDPPCTEPKIIVVAESMSEDALIRIYAGCE